MSFDADLQLLGRAIAMVIMINGCVLLSFGFVLFKTKKNCQRSSAQGMN